MITWFAVLAIMCVGAYTHYARINSPLVLLACAAILALGFSVDMMIDPPQSRFDLR